MSEKTKKAYRELAVNNNMEIAECLENAMVKYQSKLSTLLNNGYEIDEDGLQLNDYIYVRVISKVNEDDFIVIPFVMENGEYLVDLVMEW